MSEFQKISDHDSRCREDKPYEYRIDSVVPGCKVVCARPGVKLIDFYRTSSVLAKDVLSHLADLEAEQQKAKECAK